MGAQEPRMELHPLRGLETEFEFVRELGRGGSSVVYLAIERELEREVAIKTIHPLFASDPDAAARLEREARTLARLEHPNIVTFYGVRRLVDGGMAMVMQYVRGERLKDRIHAYGPLPADEVRRVLVDVARALGHAHRHHVVHRDIKPENIYLDSELGIARLSDFGIARAWDQDASLTQAGLTIGTPAYMAPEQIDGLSLDGRSDIYSLGLVGWEMLSGQRPWDGHNLYGIIYRQKNEALPAITSFRSDVLDALRTAIEIALEKDPARRWPNAEAFLARVTHQDDSPFAATGSNAAAPSGAVPGDIAPRPGGTPTARPFRMPPAAAPSGLTLTVVDDAPTIPYRPADVAASAEGAMPSLPARTAASAEGSGERALVARPAAAAAAAAIPAQSTVVSAPVPAESPAVGATSATSDGGAVPAESGSAAPTAPPPAPPITTGLGAVALGGLAAALAPEAGTVGAPGAARSPKRRGSAARGQASGGRSAGADPAGTDTDEKAAPVQTAPAASGAARKTRVAPGSRASEPARETARVGQAPGGAATSAADPIAGVEMAPGSAAASAAETIRPVAEVPASSAVDAVRETAVAREAGPAITEAAGAIHTVGETAAISSADAASMAVPAQPVPGLSAADVGEKAAPVEEPPAASAADAAGETLPPQETSGTSAIVERAPPAAVEPAQDTAVPAPTGDGAPPASAAAESTVAQRWTFPTSLDWSHPRTRPTITGRPLAPGAAPRAIQTWSPGALRPLSPEGPATSDSSTAAPELFAQVQEALASGLSPAEPKPGISRRQLIAAAAVVILALGSAIGAVSLLHRHAATSGVLVSSRANPTPAPPPAAATSTFAAAPSTTPDQVTDSEETGAQSAAIEKVRVPAPPEIAAPDLSSTETAPGPVTPTVRLLGTPVRSAKSDPAAAPPLPTVEAPPAGGAERPAAQDEDSAPAPADVSAAPTFTPFAVAPRLLNRGQVASLLERVARERGANGHVVVWVFVNQNGVAQKTQVKRSSGNAVLDSAALEVAASMRFAPALSGDRQIPVWVEVPIDVASR